MSPTSPTVPNRPNGHTTTFAVHELFRSATVITVAGGLDAANAPEFSAHTAPYARAGRRVLLDLSRVDFFGTAALSVLADFNYRCLARDVAWGLVSSIAVDRLLRISAAVLPIYPTASDALTGLPIPRRSLELIP